MMMMQYVATVLIVLCSLVGSSHAKQNQCSVGKVSCPDDSTCCALGNRSFGCCPIRNAVCCGDSVNCCPDGYTCDVIKGICKMGGTSMPPSKKIPAEPIMKVPATMKSVSHTASDGTSCTHKKYQCPKENTCCKLSSGTYGCCPSQNAVCCSDHKHCCPERYTCDLEAGKCKKRAEHINMIGKNQAIKTSLGKCKKRAERINMIKMSQAIKTPIAGEYIEGFQTRPVLQKTSAFKTKISAAVDLPPVICPDGSQCLPRRTCCRLPGGGFDCCPVPHVGLLLCPAGYNCNATSLICLRGSQNIAMFQKATATKKRICPDRTECLFSQTCCRARGGGYDCCPHPKAVCCRDGIHCCKHGEICVFGGAKCIRPIPRMALFKKVQKSSTFIALMDVYASITNCELADGHFGCCPSSKAVCCSDHEHCCPAGFRCDLTAQMLVTGNVRLPIFKKAISSRRRKIQEPNLDKKIYFVPAQTHGGDPVTDNDKLGRKSLKSYDNQT